MSLTYSNPRLEAVIENWPSGSKRTTATFRVESHASRGERATRTTIDPRTGRPSAAKVLTFSRKCRIVDGDNGRTYLIRLTEYGHISIMRSDMQLQEESIFETDPRYAAVAALFDQET